MSEPTPKDPRGPTNLRIKFRSASLDQFIARYAVDVSRGGIFIRTREPLAVGTRLKLEFQLQDAAPLLAGEGTVVWIREHDAARENVTPGMGVRFDKLSPESQPTLEKILAEKTRLEQAGVAPTGPAKGGGMAVRRPSGVFASLDTNARAVLGAAAGVESSATSSAASGPQSTPIAVPPAPAVPAGAAAAVPKTGFLASRPGVPPAPAPSGPFTRARATTTRPVPVPSALFEPPTAADIDRALEALAEVPGPTPAARPTPSVPRYVADDASNEPTRVADIVDELVGQRPIPGSLAPGSAPMTERLSGTVGTPDEPAAAPTDGSAASLDAPLDVVDVGEVQPAVPEPQAAVQAPVAPDPSKRFRAASRAYPTLNRRKRSATGFVVMVILLAAGAGVAVKLHLTDRLFRRSAPPAPVAVTPPQTPPAATATPTENPSAQPAAPEKAAPEGAGGSAAVAAAPEKPGATEKAAPAAPEEKPVEKSTEKSATEEKKPAAAEKAASPTENEEHAGKRHPLRRHAEAEGQGKETPAAAAKSATAEKPAEKPAGEKPAETAPPTEKPAAEQSTAAKAAEAAAAKPADSASEKAAAPAAAPPAPVLKVTSSPSGAQVVIDGREVGTTPLLSKEVDPAAPHTITIKKDGYEANERMVSGLDWSRPHGNNPQTLKVNAKLRRSAASPAAPAAAPAAPKENAEPEDTGGPYIKEIKPDSP